MAHEVWAHAFSIAGATAERARQAEDRGFAGLLLTDSQNLQGDVYAELAIAAGATERLGLGTGNTNPVTRHAAVTAAAIATIQVESGGRAVLGIARGDSAVSRVALPAATAVELERYVEQVQGFLGGGIDWIAAAGQPKVPVDVAATGPRVIAAGARVAERVTFAVGAEPERLEHAIAQARSARADAGLDPAGLSLGAYLNVAAHGDPAVARSLVAGVAAIYARFSTLPGIPADALTDRDRAVLESLGESYDETRHGRADASHVQLLPAAFLDRFTVAGTPAHCRERLTALFSLGLDRIVVAPFPVDADAALVAEAEAIFASDVLPAFA